jgi:AbrB family looped-hinge helix DNA binding protein
MKTDNMEYPVNMPIVSGKGWVVIPRELRNRYGLRKGDRVHVIDYGGVISIVPTSRSTGKIGQGNAE